MGRNHCSAFTSVAKARLHVYDAMLLHSYYFDGEKSSGKKDIQYIAQTQITDKWKVTKNLITANNSVTLDLSWLQMLPLASLFYKPVRVTSGMRVVWLKDRFADWQFYQKKWLIEWLAGSLTEWLIYWLPGWLRLCQEVKLSHMFSCMLHFNRGTLPRPLRCVYSV